MPSYVYFASGYLGNAQVMKIGKTNNPPQREAQIALSIHSLIRCENELIAYCIESEIRDFMILCSSLRIENRIDWFIYDEWVYDQVLTRFFQTAALLKILEARVAQLTN